MQLTANEGTKKANMITHRLNGVREGIFSQGNVWKNVWGIFGGKISVFCGDFSWKNVHVNAQRVLPGWVSISPCRITTLHVAVTIWAKSETKTVADTSQTCYIYLDMSRYI